jgi:hypothetical protein
MGSSCSAWSQNGPFSETEIRQILNKKYAESFVQEFNELQKQKIANYMYAEFMSKPERKELLKNWNSNARARTQQNAIFIEADGKVLAEIDILDLLEQRYRINGKFFTNDWSASKSLQRDLLRNLPEKRTARNSLGMALLPQANAFVVPLIEACVEFCGVAADQAAVFVAEYAPEIEALAARSSVGFRKVVIGQSAKAYRFVADKTRYILEDIYTDPEIGAFFKANKPSSPASYVKGTARGAAYAFKKISGVLGVISAAAITGFAGNYGWNAFQEKLKEGQELGASLYDVSLCLAHRQYVIANCSYAKPKTPMPKDAPTVLGGDPIDWWCPTENVNEIESTLKMKDGTLSVHIFRTPRGGKDKGGLGSAFEYEIGKDNKIIPDTIRTYESENDEITTMKQPAFKTELTTDDVHVQRKHLADSTEEAKDVQRQILRRDEVLEKNRLNGNDKLILTAKQIQDFAPPKDLTTASAEVKHMAEEEKKAIDTKAVYLFMSAFCKLLDNTSKATTPAPAGITATATGPAPIAPPEK